MILDLCDRFHKLPSEVVAESSELLRLIQIEHLGRRSAEKQQAEIPEIPDIPTH